VGAGELTGTHFMRGFMVGVVLDDPELRLLYCEVSGLIARCVFDYWSPFRDYVSPGGGGEVRLLEDVIKYRPPDPVFYPSMFDTLADYEPSVQVAVIQFYDAVERWRREVDTLVVVGRNTFDFSYMNRLQRRLGEVFPFAMTVMLELRPLVDQSVEIDRLMFAGVFSLAVDGRQNIVFDDPIQEVSRFSEIARAAKDLHFSSGSFTTKVNRGPR
jgi:hypothetical protein